MLKRSMELPYGQPIDNSDVSAVESFDKQSNPSMDQ